MTSRFSIIALGVLVSCAEPAKPSSTHTSQVSVLKPVATPRETAARYHMRRHFDDLKLIEHLLIAGKLDDGATLAYLLVHEGDDPELETWQIEAKNVTRAAVELTRSIDVDEALHREVVVAAECAACHLRSGARVIFPVPIALPDGPTMSRHAWASDRLWEAVIGNDVDRWRRGLAVLADSPISGNLLQTMARDQLTTAAGPVDPDVRAVAYGNILILCADCHTKLGAKLP